eukprot:1421808-Prymnesium_polylepis.1
MTFLLATRTVRYHAAGHVLCPQPPESSTILVNDAYGCTHTRGMRTSDAPLVANSRRGSRL